MLLCTLCAIYCTVHTIPVNNLEKGVVRLYLGNGLLALNFARHQQIGVVV